MGRELWCLVQALLFVLVSSRPYAEPDIEWMEHRVSLMEEGLRTFVYESKPSMTYLENEVSILKSENNRLQKKIEKQESEIGDLQWMVSENKKLSLTPEERDLVTELKWTVFDLKMANEILQEENCIQNTVCEDWSPWSRCSNTCGRGTRIRYRNCEKKGRFGSMCDASDFEEEPCDTGTCTGTDTNTDMNTNTNTNTNKNTNTNTNNNLLLQFDCPENYTSFNGFCFRFSERQDGRLLATKICEKEDAHLVYIDGSPKQKTVQDYLNIVAPNYMVDMNEDFSKREYWDYKDIEQKTNVAIDGIRRDQRTYILNWQDREMKYFNWADGQPRSDKNDGDYCLTLNVLTGEWYLSCCTVNFFYVCETEARISV